MRHNVGGMPESVGGTGAVKQFQSNNAPGTSSALLCPATTLHPPVCSTGRRPGGSNRIITAPGQWLASCPLSRKWAGTRWWANRRPHAPPRSNARA